MNDSVLILLSICAGAFTGIVQEKTQSWFDAIIISIITFSVIGYFIRIIYQ